MKITDRPLPINPERECDKHPRVAELLIRQRHEMTKLSARHSQEYVRLVLGLKKEAERENAS